MTSMRERLEAQLQVGNDSALLRLSLGQLLTGEGDYLGGIEHLKRALLLDTQYSAAWSALGRAYALAGESERALATFQSGINQAKKHGDKQAERQMSVFLSRLQQGKPLK